MNKDLENIDVHNLANTIIFSADQMGEYITNMDLQRILYLMKVSHYKKNGTMLFNNPLQAWDYGPVVDTVWKNYSKHGRNPINKDEEITEYNRAILQDVSNFVSNYFDIPRWEINNVINDINSPYTKARNSKDVHISEVHMN